MIDDNPKNFSTTFLNQFVLAITQNPHFNHFFKIYNYNHNKSYGQINICKDLSLVFNHVSDTDSTSLANHI